MEKTKETLQVEVKKEVDSTDITSEGGDMKVSKSKTTKKSSAKQEDGSYKVNLSETTKTKKDAVREEVSTDKKSLPKQEQEEEEGKKEEKVETPVLEEITDSEEKTEETIVKEKTDEPVLENIKETTPGMDLPENVEKLVKFMNETGGTLEDYVRLSADYSKVDDNVLLRNYLEQTKEHLNQDEISFLIEDKYSFDEDIDEPRDIQRKKLAYKEAVHDARQHLEGLKDKYYKEVKLGSKLLPEQQKAVEFFNRYNTEQDKANEQAVMAKAHFDKETDTVFNENFKGFDFKVGDKKYRYNVKDVKQTKELQSDIMNLVAPFLEKKSRKLINASGYHKMLFAASNADSISNHFYQQGKADAIKEMTSEAKNINMDARKTDIGFIDTKGGKFKVISGDDSSKLKFKLKHY
jgi:hypothetical protein